MIQKNRYVFISPLLESLGVLHGVTTRNLGTFAQDQKDANNNLSLLKDQEKLEAYPFKEVSQVHGNRVVCVDLRNKKSEEADGIITNHPLVLGIKVADCVPILLANGTGTVAAIHAGWRGTIEKITANATVQFEYFETHRKQIYAAMGPSIGPCCFQVSKDVAEKFSNLSAETVIKSESGYQVNLWLANRILLTKNGVPEDHIEKDPPCTSCHPELFFSYRRDQGQCGRHLAWILGSICSASL